MDPNITLAQIRALAHVLENRQELTDEEVLDVAYDLTDRITALDQWLTSGGFSPSAWSRP
jgi:hypothetical protein